MANPIIVTPNLMPDPDGCLPGTRQEMANFVAQAITVMFGSATGGSGYFTPVIGSTTPTPDQQSSAWFKTEASGAPIGWFIFFNGKWVRTGIPLYSEWYYSGPSSVFSGGKGQAGTQAEGFLLCNGSNGTTNLTDKFIVGSSSYTSAWISSVDPTTPGVTNGGVSTVQLTKSQLPELTFTLPIGADGGSLPRFQYGNATNNDTYNRSIPGTGNGQGGDNDPAAPHTNIPPFYARAIIQFNPYA